MSNNQTYISKKSTLLDTLAHLPTKSKLTPLQKKARSKFFTQNIVTPLIYYAQYVAKDVKLQNYFSNAYYCSDSLKQVGKNIIEVQYCNSRVCNQCNRIRTAKLMNGYVSQLSGKKQYFVTLTIPNVAADELRTSISNMVKNCSNIIRVIRERKKINVNGIRKIEITYNQKTNTYHPHIHLLVDNAADMIVTEWLKRNPTAKPIAQDIRAADENSLNELFKYTTKIGISKTKEINSSIDIQVEAIYNITKAMFNKRAFQPFGLIKKVNEDIKDNDLNSEQYPELNDYDCAYWQWQNNDWVCVSQYIVNNKGELIREQLTNYQPPPIIFNVI
tara:strand:+ start:207 stop:1199 length:993 start_codon:yes stop_codon:yes gene_type:complete